jgi:hypothetical protein
MLQENLLSLLPPCPFHAFTGLYCPGCGSTRAIFQLLQGNLIAAFRYNPLTVVFLFTLLAYSLFYVWTRMTKKPFSGFFLKPLWIWLLLAVILLFWILRNIPVYPFTVLAPY